MEDLVLSCLESRVEDNRTLYSRFLIGPFFKGDALTVATALRRVLLSSVESVAITALYIQGITHEFSTIVGVRESVLELSLNFQSIVLSYDKNFFQKKNLFEDFQIGYLQVQGPKVVYANDLKLPLGIKVVYPTQYIATVSREGVIVLKFTIGKMDNRLASSVSSHASETDSRKQIIHHPVFGELVKKNIARTKKRYSYKSIYAINTLANAPRVQSGALYEPRTLHFEVGTEARTKLRFVKPVRTKLRFVRRRQQNGALQRTWQRCKQSSVLQRTWRSLYWRVRTNRRFVCKERAFVRISKKKTNFNFSTIKRATPFFALHTKRLLIRFGENRCVDNPTNSLSEVDKNFYKANTNPAFTLQSSALLANPLQTRRVCMGDQRFARALGRTNLRFASRCKPQVPHAKLCYPMQTRRVCKGFARGCALECFALHTKLRFVRRCIPCKAPLCMAHSMQSSALQKTRQRGSKAFLALLVHRRGAKGKQSRHKCACTTRFSMRKENFEKTGASLVDYVTRTANQKALALAFVQAAKVNFTRQAHTVNIKNASFRTRNDRSHIKLRFVSDALATETNTKTFIPICNKGAFPFVPLIQSKSSVLTKAQQVKTSYKSKFWKTKSSKALIYRSFSLPANTYFAPEVQRNALLRNKSKQIQSSYKTKTDTSIFNVLCKKYISKHRLQDQEEFFKCKEMHRWTTIDRCFYKSKAPFKNSICTHHLSLNRVVGMQKQLLFAKRLNNLSFFKLKYSSLVKRGVRRVDKVFKSDICLRNIIPLDFTLPPVLRVNFVIEIDDEVLYLRQKVRERIILEVWTNGSIHPRQAVHDATLSLLDMFSSFRSLYQVKSYSPPQLKLPGYSKNLKSLYRDFH